MAVLGAGVGTGYPSAIDTIQSYTNVIAPDPDDPTRADAEFANDVLAAILAIQTELGIAPSGAFADVAARFADFTEGTPNVFTALQTFAAGILLGSDDTLAWGNAVGGGTADTILTRDAANALALRNGTTAQRFSIYDTFTDASNYTRISLYGIFSSDQPGIVAEGAGTGENPDLYVGVLGTGNLRLYANGLRWTMSTVGHLIPQLTNSSDLGSASLALRGVYAGTSYNLTGANAQNMALKHLTELTTIAAAATTDTTIQIPANSHVVGVTLRVTTVIPTAATFDIGVAGATTRYGTGISTAADTTNSAVVGTDYSSAISVRITPNLTPADTTGRVRITVHYLDLTPPTS